MKLLLAKLEDPRKDSFSDPRGDQILKEVKPDAIQVRVRYGLPVLFLQVDEKAQMA
jgi:hypothetical protein